MGKGTLWKRTVSGVLFLVVVIGCMLSPWGILAFVSLLSVLLSYEFYRMTVDRKYRKEMVCVSLGSLVTLVLLWCHFQFGLDAKYAMLGFLPVAAASIILLFDAAPTHDFPTAVYFPLVYITLPLAALLMLAYPCGNFGWRLLLGLFVLLWLCDIGAYLVGMAFGQRPNSRKLFPALSPKKSWIGVVGGTLFTFLAAWGVHATFGAAVLPLAHWLALALLVAVFSVPGDLFESLIKRHAQVKDAGQLIPGHGGLLDRFDDVLLVVPIVAIYLKLFSLI